MDLGYKFLYDIFKFNKFFFNNYSFQLWTGWKPDLLKLPMNPCGSVVMAHVLLDLHTTDGPWSILHPAVGTAVGHQGGGL